MKKRLFWLLIFLQINSVLVGQQFREENVREAARAAFDAIVTDSTGEIFYVKAFRQSTGRSNAAGTIFTHELTVRKGDAVLQIPFWDIQKIEVEREVGREPYGPPRVNPPHQQLQQINVIFTDGTSDRFILASRGDYFGVIRFGQWRIGPGSVKTIKFTHDGVSQFCQESKFIIFSQSNISPISGDKMQTIRADNRQYRIRPFVSVPANYQVLSN